MIILLIVLRYFVKHQGLSKGAIAPFFSLIAVTKGEI